MVGGVVTMRWLWWCRSTVVIVQTFNRQRKAETQMRVGGRRETCAEFEFDFDRVGWQHLRTRLILVTGARQSTGGWGDAQRAPLGSHVQTTAQESAHGL